MPEGGLDGYVVECLFADWWRSAAANWTDRGCKPSSIRLHANSKVLSSTVALARLPSGYLLHHLLALYPALRSFTSIEGVEPTNNHVERILRLGVLWRKNSFGCHSAAGCRFVERIFTLVQTLPLQKRPVLYYLYRAIVSHRSVLPAPQLLRQSGD